MCDAERGRTFIIWNVTPSAVSGRSMPTHVFHRAGLSLARGGGDTFTDGTGVDIERALHTVKMICRKRGSCRLRGAIAIGDARNATARGACGHLCHRDFLYFALLPYTYSGWQVNIHAP